jgi:hypothetical protein
MLALAASACHNGTHNTSQGGFKMPYICDHCEEELYVDRGGYFVGKDKTSECPENEGGHTWEGRIGL